MIVHSVTNKMVESKSINYEVNGHQESATLVEWEDGNGYYLNFTDHTNTSQMVSLYKEQLEALQLLLNW